MVEIEVVSKKRKSVEGEVARHWLGEKGAKLGGKGAA